MSPPPSNSFMEAGRNCQRMCSKDCDNVSTLQLEAFAAVREVAGYVKSIYLSDVLPRTPELLFLNLLTIEGDCYCIELSQRGWRICSDRHDCMYGDFRKLDMFARYFETIYQLLDTISPEYRKRFGENLISRLNQLEK